MKKLLSIFLAAILIFSGVYAASKYMPEVSAAESPENLITNGGFENVENWSEKGGNGWWWISGAASTSTKRLTDTEHYGESGYSLRLENGTGPDRCWNIFSVKENTNYIVSFKAKFSSISDRAYWCINTEADPENKNTTPIITNKFEVTGEKETFNWVTKACEFNSGNNTSLALVFATYTGTLGYIDDVSVVEVTASDNLIKDGGFEYGKLYWGVDGQNINALSDKWVGNYFKTGEGRTGSSATVEKGYNKYLFTKFDCEANTDYLLTYYAKSAKGIKTVVLPSSYVEGGKKINNIADSNSLVKKNTDDTYAGENTEFTKRELIFNSGNNTELALAFYRVSGSTGNTDNRFDNVSVVKMNKSANVAISTISEGKFAPDSNGYFVPYGSIMNGDTAAKKNADGSFDVSGITEDFTVDYFKAPSENGITTFGVGYKGVTTGYETEKENAAGLQFGSYTESAADGKEFYTLVIRGQDDATVNKLSDSLKTSMVNKYLSWNLGLDDKWGGYTDSASGTKYEIKVVKQSNYMWKNTDGTNLQYAVRLYGDFTDNTELAGKSFSAIGFSKNGNEITFASSFKTASYSSLAN